MTRLFRDRRVRFVLTLVAPLGCLLGWPGVAVAAASPLSATGAGGPGAVAGPVTAPFGSQLGAATEGLSPGYDTRPRRSAGRAVTLGDSRILAGYDAVLGRKRSIQGRVTDQTGNPPLFATVTAYGSDGDYAGSVQTSSTGRYSIPLSPGSYRLKIVGYGDEYSTEFYNNASSLSAATAIALGSEADATGYDVVLGLRTSHIQGLVTDAVGNPLPMVFVTAYDPDGLPAGSGFSDFVTGAYSVALDPGTYRLEFREYGGVHATEYFDNVFNLGAGTPIPLGANQTLTGYDASLMLAGRISGRVTNTSGSPLGGKSVVVYDTAGDFVTSDQTDSGGDYSIPLGLGSYRIGFHDWGGTYISEYWDNAATLGSANAIALALEQTVSGRDATLSRYSLIQGLVTSDSGSPLRGIYVTAYNSGGAYAGHSITTTTGAYSVALPLGTYRLEFRDNSGMWTTEYYDNASSLGSAARITLGAEQTLTGYNASLRPTTDDVIQGRVTNESGGPLAGIRVAAVEADGNIGASTSTSSTGEYSLALRPGTYHLGFYDLDGEYVTEFFDNATTIGGAAHVVVERVGTPTAPTMMSRKKYYTVSGYLMPRHTAGTSPVRIYKERLVSGVWKSFGYVTAKVKNHSTYSRYSKSLRLSTKGKWRLSAYHAAAGHPAIRSSGYDYVTVK